MSEDPILSIRIGTEPILPSSLPDLPIGTTGAVLEFSGRVRDRENGDTIRELHYEAYPEMAEKEFQRLVSEIHPVAPIQAVAIWHRIGWIPVGDAAIYLRIAAKHRAEALSFCETFLHRMKQDVPIWKTDTR